MDDKTYNGRQNLLTSRVHCQKRLFGSLEYAGPHFGLCWIREEYQQTIKPTLAFWQKTPNQILKTHATEAPVLKYGT